MESLIVFKFTLLENLLPKTVAALGMACKVGLKWVKENIRDETVTDASRDIMEIIESRGFVAEKHQVTTDDGYIITLHRVINPLVNRQKRERSAVLLLHGFAASSSHWVINSEKGHLKPVVKGDIDPDQVDDSLAFALANQGYDVWMVNTRGNKYSIEHKVLDPQTDSKFWDFSMDEMIAYDLPSAIDHVLQTTGQKTLAFVGISQGTTIMFGLLASQPKYSDIIKPFIAMAPVLVTSEVASFVPYFIKCTTLTAFIELLKLNPGPFFEPIVESLTKKVFSGHVFEKQVNLMAALSSSLMIEQEIRTDRLNVFAAHAGLHFSRKNLAHCLQMHLANRFQKFDFSREANLKLYGRVSPPRYPVEKITNKHIAFLTSKNDMFVGEKDLNFLRNQLTVDLIDDYVVPNDKWNHCDFQLGNKCGKYVNFKVVEILERVRKECERLEGDDVVQIQPKGGQGQGEENIAARFAGFAGLEEVEEEEEEEGSEDPPSLASSAGSWEKM